MIEINHISKYYRDAAFPAVDNLSLTITDHSFVALLGASGSGKTTVLKTINRLIEPDQGKVHINGIAVTSMEASVLRRGIGYVFQGSGLFPHLTIAENIGITPKLLGWKKESIRSRVLELLTMVDLPEEFAARLPHQLSGGQQQRVAIARALGAAPPIMLMDEPFGALDPVTRDTLNSTYRQLHETLGLTTVMVTHDIQEALLLADRIVVMKKGTIIADFLPMDALLQLHPDVHEMITMSLRQSKKVEQLLKESFNE